VLDKCVCLVTKEYTNVDIKKIHYRDIEYKLKGCKLIHTDNDLGWQGEKNGGSLYTDNTYYYKTWNSNWDKADIVEKAFNDKFYDNIVSAFESLIYDDTGNRGYITRSAKKLFIGKSFYNFSVLLSQTTKEQRKDFMFNLIDNTINCGKYIYYDLTPNNMVLYNGMISLIDFESCTGFDIIKKYNSEPVSLYNHTNTMYKHYLNKCLNIEYNKDISSKQSLIEIKYLIKNS